MTMAQTISALGPFGTGLSQRARLLTLASAQDRALPEALIPEQMRGREGVNELYQFEVIALSTSAHLDLETFIGEELTLTLLQPDDSRRAWHGICTSAECIGSDGGVARYRLQLEPALALLQHRRDSYIFQDKSVQEILVKLLSDYPQLRFAFDLQEELAPRAICTQYRESDYQFFTRIMASEGLSWRFEHDQADEAADGQSRHRLVIFDADARAPETPPNSSIRFHGVRATDSDDAIDQFAARREAQSNAVAISSWDPAQLLAPAAEQQTRLEAGDIPVLPTYDGSGERIASDSGAADRHSLLMLKALELDNKRFDGHGSVRRLAAGHRFELTQHERYPSGENAFKVLWVEHEGRNNVQAQIASDSRGQIENGTYRNRFCCVRESVSVVPRATALPHPHTALDSQTALVVGIANAISTTMRDHQVRIQFAWQRGRNPNPGGLEHDTDEQGHAPGDERSGTWVRVAEALAGPNWGSQFTPRIGTEVLVDFIEGDMDRPLVVAQLYTGSDLPPFSAGEESGVNHAGTLSGIHSHNFDGGGYNQWQLDDTSGQVRTRLATSSAATQLNLGYLIEQSPGGAHRGSYRGSGFELRTDAWAVVRGGEGVLLSTTMRARLGSGVTSSQMDVREAVALSKGAQDLVIRLTEAAEQQKALFSKEALKAQEEFIDQIDANAKGKYGGPLNGQEALKAKAGSRELDADDPVEKFASPIVLMEAPTSINWATPASTVIFAGEQLQWTTQSDLHVAAAHTVSTVAANAVNLFSHSGGIQAIAANGPVSLQAHTDQLEVLADKAITVISVNDRIEIKAKEKIVLQSGQSSITLDGGGITFACPGNFTVKGSQHIFDEEAVKYAELNQLPDTRLKLFKERVRAIDAQSGEVIPNLRS